MRSTPPDGPYRRRGPAAGVRARLWGGVRWVLRALVHLGWWQAPTGTDPRASGALDWVDGVGRRGRGPGSGDAAHPDPDLSPDPGPGPGQPPPGHPERVVPHAPLTPQEQALWAQLNDRAA